MFNRRDSSGASGDGGRSSKGRGFLAGRFRLPHRSSFRTKRRNQHVNYDFSYFNRTWSKLRGKPPRIPGTVRGKRRWANHYFPKAPPMASHGGRRKGLSSGGKLLQAPTASFTGKRRKLGRKFTGITVPTARHGGKKRKMRGLGVQSPYESHGGKKRQKNVTKVAGLLATGTYRGGRKKEIQSLSPSGLLSASYVGGKQRKYRVVTGNGFLTSGGYRGGVRKDISGGSPLGLLTPSYGGSKRKYKVVTRAVAPSHRGKARKRKILETSAYLSGSHRGNRRRVSGNTVYGIPHVAHTGSRRKNNELVVPARRPYEGKRKSLPGLEMYAVPKALGRAHRGSRYQRHASRSAFGVPHVAHTGSGQRRHKIGLIFGVPHVAYKGSGQNQHSNPWHGFAFGGGYSGSRRKGSGGSLVKTGAVVHKGSRKSHHRLFGGYHTQEAYRPSLLYNGRKANTGALVSSGTVRRYKVRKVTRGRGMEITGYRSQLAKNKYKPKKQRLPLSGSGNVNQTALRRANMQYLKKKSKGKKRKKNETGLYQGHVSFNELLYGIILILSILTAITLFILATTVDQWLENDADTLVEESEISTLSTYCEKKT